jgi:hypothetical protein
MENLETRVAEMFRRDARAPRILIAETVTVYWALLLRHGDPRWLPVWREFLDGAIVAGIRTAELAVEMGMQAAEAATEAEVSTKGRKKRR